MDAQIERNRLELIIALRSGRYEQCGGTLFRGKQKCFAGLAMHLFSIAQSWDDVYKKSERIAWHEVHAALGFPMDTDEVIYTKFPLWPMVRANDSGKSFAEIADLLVENYKFPEAPVAVPEKEEVMV